MPRRAFSVPWRVCSFTYRLLSGIKRQRGAGIPWHPPSTRPQCSPTAHGAGGGSPQARSRREGVADACSRRSWKGKGGESNSGFLQNFLPTAKTPTGAGQFPACKWGDPAATRAAGLGVLPVGALIGMQGQAEKVHVISTRSMA